ncbi:MAG: tRNA dihydrouridine synthase DusB [Armatimonadetes bacterium]|nr:tRNA dihydrouridine synthase DusB [Armatimonadota bacterium]
MNPFKIGNVVIDPPLALAPMAGVTNHAFRIVCKRLGGVGLVSTEMFSAYAIKFRDPRTKSMIDWTDEERPISAQVFAGDPETVAIGARALQDWGDDIVDVNFGCPVPKVAKSGSGAMLLKNIDLCREILIATRQVLNVPLSIKCRIGWAADDRAVFELAKTAQICGVDSITVHARTASQGYSGAADWDIIGEVKKLVGIPVIANGDVKTPEDAARIMEQTGCDGVMIGRAALGNPFIFAHSAEYLRTGIVPPEPTYAERMEAAIEHASILAGILGYARAARELRGHLVHYFKGMPGAPKLRARVMTTKSVEEILEVLNEARCKCEPGLFEA